MRLRLRRRARARWAKGSKLYWPNTLLRKVIRPAAVRTGITGIKKRIGWHTLRHTYATMIIANVKLAVFDLEAKKTTAIHFVGADPDVLAFDKGFGRLYVFAESGILTIFDERGRNLEKVGEGLFAANAHSVAVDSRTHRVYFP